MKKLLFSKPITTQIEILPHYVLVAADVGKSTNLKINLPLAIVDKKTW